MHVECDEYGVETVPKLCIYKCINDKQVQNGVADIGME